MSKDTTDRWLSVAEITRHLGVKPTSIYKWITRKAMLAHKVGRLWKFKVNEVDEWVRSGMAASSSAEDLSARASNDSKKLNGNLSHARK